MDDTMYDKITPKSLALYSIVFVGIMVYCQSIDVTLGSLVGVIVSCIVILLLYKYNEEIVIGEEKLHELKANYINPEPTNIQKYVDMTDLVFSIQEFHSYNPQVYEHMVDTIDTFLEVYANCMLDSSLAGESYSIAERHKQMALNDLHSIIYTSPASKLVTQKLDDAVIKLEELLNNYLYAIFEKNQEYLKENGFFNNSKIIELNIQPYNKSPEHLPPSSKVGSYPENYYE